MLLHTGLPSQPLLLLSRKQDRILHQPLYGGWVGSSSIFQFIFFSLLILFFFSGSSAWHIHGKDTFIVDGLQSYKK